jgi:hypothetical protein
MSRLSISRLLRHTHITRKLRSSSGITALALMVLILPACNLNRQATAPSNATAEKVADNTDRWIGLRSQSISRV